MAKVSQLQLAANRIAARTAISVGLDPATILGILTGLFAIFQQCRKESEPADAQAWLKSQWNEKRQRFSARAMNAAKKQVKAQIKRDGLSRDDIHITEAAHQILLEGLHQPAKVVAACMREAE